LNTASLRDDEERLRSGNCVRSECTRHSLCDSDGAVVTKPRLKTANCIRHMYKDTVPLLQMNTALLWLNAMLVTQSASCYYHSADCHKLLVNCCRAKYHYRQLCSDTAVETDSLQAQLAHNSLAHAVTSIKFIRHYRQN